MLKTIFTILLVLKLLGAISLSWFQVCIPLIILVAVNIIKFLICAIMYVIANQ